MKIIRIFTLALLTCFATNSAHSQAFDIGDNVVALGIGLGSTYGHGFGYAGSGYRQSPAINLQYERGMWEAGPGVISLGGFVGYKSFNYRDSDFSVNYTNIGVRSAYHYHGIDNDKIDVYGGLMLSYLNINSNLGSLGSASSGGLRFDLYVGGRYYFMENLAGFAELGFGFTVLNVGVALKF
ncbi:MAG: hypothetical protein ACFCUU_18835 [Cyclobacteriaceae bacterium]